MIIHIVGGGPEEFLPDLLQYKEKELFWIGVDRGTRYLMERGITPDLAIGDFDSIRHEDMELYKDQIFKILTYQPEKDETDMELALRYAIGKSPSLIRIFGATGGRLDHLLANIFLLKKAQELKSDITVEIIDSFNVAWISSPGKYTIRKDEHKYISFLPLSEHVKNLTLIGFKYPLKECHILFGSTLCISNELISNEGTYSFSEGTLMVVKAKDK